MSRKVPPETLWRVARSTLGRMACVYADPLRDEHPHDDCVRDDESFVADQLLGLVAAVATNDEDGALNRLTEILETARPLDRHVAT